MNAKWMFPVVIAAGLAGAAAVAGDHNRDATRRMDDQGRTPLTLLQAATIGEVHGKGRAVKAELEDGKVWKITVFADDAKRPQKLYFDAFSGQPIEPKKR